MKKTISIAIAIFIIQTGGLPAFVEINTNFEDETPGYKPQTAAPVAGTVASKPAYINNSGDDRVVIRIDSVKELKGKAIVIEDNASETSGGQGAIYFSQGAYNAVYNGKIYIHLDWMTVQAVTGNVGFLGIENYHHDNLFSMVFSGDRRGLSVVGEEITHLDSALMAEEPVAIDIILDLDNWSYELSLNGKEAADGKMKKTNDNSFYLLQISTSSPGKSTIAINNLSISQVPPKNKITP